MRHRLLGFLLVTTCLGVLAPSASFAALREIPAGRTIVSVGERSSKIVDAFTAESGVVPGATMWYLELFQPVGSEKGRLATIADDARRRPNAALDIGLSFGAISTPTYSRAPQIARGKYDEQIDVLAAWLKQLDRAVFLRVGYEFDLFGGQYGSPATYIAVYRRVVDRLRRAGVDNVAYVWHSAGIFTPFDGRIPIQRFYPGRDYVDYFGISYWGDSFLFSGGSRAGRAHYQRGTRKFLDQAKRLGLPIVYSETSLAYVGANSGTASVEWLDKYFALVDEYDIRSLNLITQDWGAVAKNFLGRQVKFFDLDVWKGFWADSRVTHYADTRERFLDEIAKPRYIVGSPQLNDWLRGRTPEPSS